MNTDQIIALAIFAAVSSITPGPNNLMLLASGVNFGVRRSLPHYAGVTSGFLLLILCLGFGLKSVFIAYPQLEVVLRYVGAACLLYTSDAANDLLCVDLGGRRIIKKKKTTAQYIIHALSQTHTQV